MYDLAAKSMQVSSPVFWKRYRPKAPTADDLQRIYLTPVLNYVVARLGASAEAEDITAEIFAAAFESLHRCPAPSDHGDDPARAYLFGIARRKLADLYRRRGRRPEVALTNDIVAPHTHGPEGRFLADEASAKLHRILSEIPEPQAEALRLKYVEDLSLGEIGAILKKRPGAVAQLLHRAKANVRKRGGAYFDMDAKEEGTSNER